MRNPTLLLLGLLLAAAPALAAGRADAPRPPVTAPAKVAAPAAPAGRPAAARAAPSCGPRHGRHRACHAAATGRTPHGGVHGWSHGLEPAARVQAQECPDGTLATLARGHDDIVRCMPI